MKIKEKIQKAIYNILKRVIKKELILFIYSKKSYKYKNLDILYDSLPKNYKIKKIKDIVSLKNIYLLAKAKIIILDQSTKFTAWFNLSDKTKCVQIWHSSGLYKMIGYDALRKNHSYEEEVKRVHRIHGQIDYFIISDKKLVPYYAKAFKKDESIFLPLGLIRTDELFDTKRKEENKKQKVLYAPTFRAHDENRHNIYKLEIEKLQENLGDTYEFLLRKHPTTDKEEVPDGWIDVSDIDQNILLKNVDILITDYSSILFDFSLLKRPILIFIPDIEEYTINERDLYIRPEELCPGCVCYTTECVIEKLKENSFQDNFIKERFMNNCDGKSTERVRDFILNLYKE